MPDLYPTFELPDIVEEQVQLDPEYPQSYLFDFEKGEFVTDSAGRVMIADGHRAWVQWCIKAVLTERYSCLGYSSDYGIEIEKALKYNDRRIIEMEIERTITEALLVDPRTEAVKDFDFTWNGDELYVSFTVVPVIGDEVRIEGVRLSG